MDRFGRKKVITIKITMCATMMTILIILGFIENPP